VSRSVTMLGAAAALATLAAVVVPASGAGAGDSCTAWGTLPSRVALSPQGVTVRATLHGTAACTAESFDNGGTAVLRGPGANDDAPMRWSRMGASDWATYYPSLDRPGTYRLVDGRTQTYDADEIRIPSSWRATATVVKYQGRFTRVAVHDGGASASLQAYGATGWAGQGHVAVQLQRWARGAWHAVARGRTSASGHAHLNAHISASGDYRLVSATTKNVWSTTRSVVDSR
jgi:hypothetical protein